MKAAASRQVMHFSPSAPIRIYPFFVAMTQLGEKMAAKTRPSAKDVLRSAEQHSYNKT